MNDQDLKRMLRRIVLGVSAAPLLWLPACGRSALSLDLDPPDASVIPSRDAGVSDAGFRDAGIRDAGFIDAGRDAGDWKILFPGCGPFGPVDTSQGPIFRDGGLAMLTPAACAQLCGMDFFGQVITECTPASSWELVCWGEFCAVGRLAEGIETRADGCGVGRAFADMAAHEAAAVVAFEQLAVELSEHAMPLALCSGARRAAQEERRHTRLVGALSRRRGGRFGISRERPTRVRSLEAIAIDNAVEGCARETFGAMVGLYQSMHAVDPAVRAVMASVSEDELGHAAWSWALARELNSRLPLATRRKVREARDGALERLTHGVLVGHSPAERFELGLPDEERLEVMAASLRETF